MTCNLWVNEPITLLALALKEDFQSIYDIVLSNTSVTCDEKDQE